MTAPHIGPILVAEELDAVRSYMTEEAFSAFLEQCLHHIAKHIGELEKSPAHPDRLATLVHSMIGTAGVIGAAQVAMIARRLEAAVAADARDATGELTLQLIDAWAEAGRELKLRRDFLPGFPTCVESVPARSPARPPKSLYNMGGRAGERVGTD